MTVLTKLPWLDEPLKAIDEDAKQQALDRQASLTKPQGSLGRLEQVAVSLSGMQGVLKPSVDKIGITVFAADHGVAEEGVSAFPQAVTTEMIRNFSTGGAAISVLARKLEANLEVVDVGAVNDVGDFPNVISRSIAKGTANFCKSRAMTLEQLADAMQAGREAVLRQMNAGVELFIGGEMGIANTSSATAIACALLQLPVESLVGPGTGLDNKGIEHKARIIQGALDMHGLDGSDVSEVLSCLGGFEIAALAGAYISCAQNGLPVLVDGFISSVAALAAIKMRPGVDQWLLFSHCSAEPGHRRIIAAIDVNPLLNLDMRLGEGSGAAVAVSLLQCACALHGQMATFSEASVSDSL